METSNNLFRSTGRAAILVLALSIATTSRSQNASINTDNATPGLNTSGATNSSAFGDQALWSIRNGGILLGGADNDGLGRNTMYAMTTGAGNVALGNDALYNSNTSENMGIGYRTLYWIDGPHNTAIGSGALTGLTGVVNIQENTALGYQTLTSLGGFSGSETGNSALGAYADVAPNCRNQTALGANALTTMDDQFVVGDGAIVDIEAQVAVTVISDQQFKTNVEEQNVKGLDFILRLKPVMYNFDGKKYTEIITTGMPEKKRAHYVNRDFSSSAAPRVSGFIAQEVETAAKECNFEFDAITVPKKENQIYNLCYGQFVVPLVKAMQEQQNLIEKLRAEIDELDKTLAGPQNTLIEISSAKDQLTIRSTVASLDQSTSLVICNAEGKKIAAFDLTATKSSNTLNKSIMDAGAAFCAIVSGGKVLEYRSLK